MEGIGFDILSFQWFLSPSCVVSSASRPFNRPSFRPSVSQLCRTNRRKGTGWWGRGRERREGGGEEGEEKEEGKEGVLE